MTRRIDRADTPADIRLRELLDGPEPRSAVVVAGAGSGKTTSLIKALDHLERNHGTALRGNRQKIACITYTNVAVEEIRTDLRDSPLVHAATINSFLWELIRPFQRDIASWVADRAPQRLLELIEERDGFSPRVQQKKRDESAAAIAKLKEAIENLEKITLFKYETTSNYARGQLGHADVQRMVPELLHAKPLLATLVARQYPYCFVDESQDTYPNVVRALKHVAATHPERFRLFFFGDPMQQIYSSGIGDVGVEDGWVRIEKPENYRSKAQVLKVVNNIRARGDGLVQTHATSDGHEETSADDGTARLFVLPADDTRTENLRRVRAWLAKRSGDGRWLEASKDAHTRTLVIARRMAAIRLGYGDLFAAFNDGTPDSIHAAFDEGSAWPLVPFIRIIIPILEASAGCSDFALISLLRSHCPRLSQEAFMATAEPSVLLKALKHDVEELAETASNPGSTVREVLRAVANSDLIRLDGRFGSIDAGSSAEETPMETVTDEPSAEDYPRLPRKVVASFLNCRFEQLLEYYRHLTVQSPYSTQHGVKGAEFPRVLVVLDDAEGRHNQYSYDVLLGQKELKPPKTGGETTLDRTLRLFYVCCSRATSDLAVVYFTAAADKAYTDLLTAGLFDPDEIYTRKDLDADLG